MKNIFVLAIFLIISSVAFGEGEYSSETYEEAQNQSITLPSNYQQFKTTLINYSPQRKRIPETNFRKGDNYLMLYVAGGVVLVSSAIVLINGSNGYETGLGASNTGIIIGGVVMSGLIVTKYFVDKNRR